MVNIRYFVGPHPCERNKIPVIFTPIDFPSFFPTFERATFFFFILFLFGLHLAISQRGRITAWITFEYHLPLWFHPSPWTLFFETKLIWARKHHVYKAIICPIRDLNLKLARNQLRTPFGTKPTLKGQSPTPLWVYKPRFYIQLITPIGPSPESQTQI